VNPTPIGPQHPRVKQVRQVINNAAGQRHLFVAEGMWAHETLIELDADPELFLWCPEAALSPGAEHIAQQMATRAGEAYQISPRVLDRITARDRPDGLVSLVAVPRWHPDSVVLPTDPLILVADGVEIPGNLGTLLRTVDACGAAALLLTNRRTRLSHPKVFRGSRGMNLKVPVLEFTEPADADKWLRERDFNVYLATVDPDATDYRDVSFRGPTALVVGNERYGISAPWLASGHPRVTVPMRGRADSLNVSISASILLYAAVTTAPR
jgi:TrmH family RNA methyltransferase